MVLCEGRTEEGTKQGTAASGGTLFKWRCREQRKGRGSGVGVHVRAGEEGRGGPCAAVGSAGRSAGAGGGAIARTCESSGA
jgi:hypothetical protein